LTKQWHGGKGSKPRPTDQNKYNDNWDAIFGKKKKKKTPTEDKKVINTSIEE